MVHGNHHTVVSVYIRSKSLSRVPLFGTLWIVACQALLSMRFSSQEYWGGLPCPPPDLPDPGIEPVSLTPPALAGRFFTTSAIWEVLVCGI